LEIVDSREKIIQKINEIVYHPVYKNYLILFLLCDTGHDGEYNAIEQNPLITYYINFGVDFGELNQILSSFYYSLPDNFPKNQEGLKKLENNLLKQMCASLGLPDVTDIVIEHDGLYTKETSLFKELKKIREEFNKYVIETYRKNKDEGNSNPGDNNINRYTISNKYDCNINIGELINFTINEKNFILPNPFPNAISFLYDYTDKSDEIIPGNLSEIFNNFNIGNETKIKIIEKIILLLKEIKENDSQPSENKRLKSDQENIKNIVIIHIFNETVGVQFKQVTLNQVSNYTLGYSKRNGSKGDAYDILNSMRISKHKDEYRDKNERDCIATMGKQMGDLITIHAFNTDTNNTSLKRALITLDRFCATLNVFMFGTSIFQAPKKNEKTSMSVLSYIFNKTEDISTSFINNFFDKFLKEHFNTTILDDKMRELVTNDKCGNEMSFKNYLIQKTTTNPSFVK